MILDKGSAKKSGITPSNDRLVSKHRQQEFDILSLNSITPESMKVAGVACVINSNI